MLSRQPGTASNDADVLARESTADDITSNVSDVSHVMEDGHVGPVPLKHSSLVGVAFGKGDCLHSGPLESKAETSNSRKQV
jgi:hypothetical protein